MTDKKTLDYYVSELRRVEKSRQANSEKEIKKIFKRLLKDINSFLAEEYVNFSNGEGILSVAVLQEKARYAKFLQEVDERLKSITADEAKAIQKAVKDTYKAVYEGMNEAVKSSVDSEDLKSRLEGLSIRPEVMNRAVNNPISGLTLPDTLEKHRNEIIYNIKQCINIGLMTGERYDTMAKNVKKVIAGDNGVGGSYGKAVNIVRTETHRVQESGLYDCAKEIAQCLEGSDLIYAATWHNMGDQKVRPNVRVHTSKGWKTYKAHTTANHQKLEGLTIKVGDKFEIEPGVFAECPGSSGTARNDCNCRCFLEYSLMTVEEFAKATGKTVEEVKKSQNIQENEVEKSVESGIIKTEKDNLQKLLSEPEKLFASYSPKTLKETLEKSGYDVKPLSRGSLKNILFEQGGGYKINFEDGGLLQYHPESRSHHDTAYYKISTGKGGTHRYEIDGTEKKEV